MFSKQQYIAVFLLMGFVALTASQGAYLLGNKKHPTLSDHCYDDEYDLTIKVNETLSPTGIEWKCFKVLCRPDYVLQYNNCQRGVPACDKKPDFSKPYPECCNPVC